MKLFFPLLDGRSKSKITVDGRCKLLLIREETGSPSRQLSQWADVLLLVFSYADIDSLNQVRKRGTRVHIYNMVYNLSCYLFMAS